jgi:hypothetical protein
MLPVDDKPCAVPERAKVKPRRVIYFKHFKIDELLPAEHRPAYEKLMRDPKSTVPVLQKWLAEHGVVVNRNAVSNHRKHNHLDARRVQECAAMAAAFCELTRRFGPAAVAEAAHARFEMSLMQHVFNEKDAPQFPREQWESLAKLTRAAVQTRHAVEELRAECQRREREEAAEREKANKRPATMQEVVARMRKTLGLDHDDDAAPVPSRPGAAN